MAEPKGKWVVKDGHPEWESATKDGEASNLHDLPEYMNKPAPRTGHRWGGWIYEAVTRTLRHDDGVNRYSGVELCHMANAKEFVNWLESVNGKGEWVTGLVLGDFVKAVDYIIGLDRVARGGSA